MHAGKIGSGLRLTSLVPRPRIRREKWPGIHCLRIRERFRKFSANKSEYGQVTHGCYAVKKTKLDIRLAVWQLCLRGDCFSYLSSLYLTETSLLPRPRTQLSNPSRQPTTSCQL